MDEMKKLENLTTNSTFSAGAEIKQLENLTTNATLSAGVQIEQLENLTTNATLSEESDLAQCTRYGAFFTTSVVVGVVIALTVFFGNSLIITALRRFPARFKGGIFLFIGNLAAADILLGFGMTLHLVSLSFNAWNMKEGMIFCSVKTVILTVSLLCSGITLSLYSFDRLVAVVFPLRHFLRHRHRKKIWSSIYITWFLSVSLPTAPTIYKLLTEKNEPALCRFSTNIPRIVALGVVGFLLLQLLFNSILIAFVIWKVWNRNKNLEKDLGIVNGIVCTTIPERTTISSKSKLMVKVYVVFALCWCPFITMTLLLERDIPLWQRRQYTCIREYSLFLGFISSGLNWIVYGLMNKRFKDAFKRLLCCAENNSLAESDMISSSRRTQQMTTLV